jgi:prepilin signal peptidase PulO-like enzyme (type II secretory pathway)
MEPIILMICLAGLIVGSITDLRTREVPDWINYGLMFAGFGIALIYTVLNQSFQHLIESIIGFGIFFAIAWIMYYTGQWGGGDSKMIMGLGALVGITWPFSSWFNIDFYTNGLPFMLNFILYSIVVGAIYGLLWSTVLAIINRKKLFKEFKRLLQTKKIVFYKKILIGILAIAIISQFFVDKNFKILILTMVLIIGIGFYLFIYIKSIEKVCMLKMVIPEKLTIGDWIAKDVIINEKVICGPDDLGIEEDQIKKLITLKKKGKIKEILIKEGIPFVPSFLIAFLLTLFYGSNLFLHFL